MSFFEIISVFIDDRVICVYLKDRQLQYKILKSYNNDNDEERAKFRFSYSR